MAHQKLKSCVVVSVRNSVSFRWTQSFHQKPEWVSTDRQSQHKISTTMILKTKLNYTKQEIQVEKEHVEWAGYRWEKSGRGRQLERGWEEEVYRRSKFAPGENLYKIRENAANLKQWHSRPEGQKGCRWLLFAFAFQNTRGIFRSRIVWISAAPPQATTQVQNGLLCISWQDKPSSVTPSLGCLSVRRFSSECRQETGSHVTLQREKTNRSVYTVPVTVAIIQRAEVASEGIRMPPPLVSLLACWSHLAPKAQRFVWTHVASTSIHPSIHFLFLLFSNFASQGSAGAYSLNILLENSLRRCSWRCPSNLSTKHKHGSERLEEHRSHLEKGKINTN